uniref:uncharacterized protein LOC120890426 n=1 Tax=Ictidomys tridecemlineatus TaxID=43179 RepID=UPI001A9DB89B|nr:uncharacterized protein LOC120890426 [Ictidomys tridecemlineatus]
MEAEGQRETEGQDRRVGAGAERWGTALGHGSSTAACAPLAGRVWLLPSPGPLQGERVDVEQWPRSGRYGAVCSGGLRPAPSGDSLWRGPGAAGGWEAPLGLPSPEASRDDCGSLGGQGWACALRGAGRRSPGATRSSGCQPPLQACARVCPAADVERPLGQADSGWDQGAPCPPTEGDRLHLPLLSDWASLAARLPGQVTSAQGAPASVDQQVSRALGGLHCPGVHMLWPPFLPCSTPSLGALGALSVKRPRLLLSTLRAAPRPRPCSEARPFSGRCVETSVLSRGSWRHKALG